MALLAAAVPVVLPFLGGLPPTPTALVLVEWCISVLVALTGILAGAAFAVAAELQLSILQRAEATAAGVVGADHIGACFGALFSGVFLVPVLGTVAAALLLAAIKVSSVVLLAAGRRLSRGA